jgi:hypothetical protein
MTNESNIPDFDQETAEFFARLFQDSLSGIKAQLIDRVATMEESLEKMEKQVATLILGYGEQAVFMEALVAQIAFASDDARRTFQEDVTRARKQMLEVMNDASKGFLADDDPRVAAALGDLAERKLSDTDS